MMQETPADLSGYQDDPNKSTDEIGTKSRTSGSGGGGGSGTYIDISSHRVGCFIILILTPKFYQFFAYLLQVYYFLDNDWEVKRHRKSELHNLRSLNLSDFHGLLKTLITCQFITKCFNYCLRILLISTYSCKCNGLEANAIRKLFVCPLPFFISKFENYCNFSVFSNLVYLRLFGKWHPILITYGP